MKASSPTEDERANARRWLAQVDTGRLERTVRELEGPRHPRATPEALARAETLVADELATAGLRVERRPFDWRGTAYNNVVGTLPGSDQEASRVLVGAHFDTVSNSPGADDNASGVAALLEMARHAANLRIHRTLEFVGFNLEEPQDAFGRYRVGSARFVEQARRAGVPYRGALILEMVGYTSPDSGAQQVPPLVFKRVPDQADFLAAVGDGRSRRLLRRFAEYARQGCPELELVTYRVFFKGWALPLTRLSDNASFWDAGYPALMITDTAFLRNPNYHTEFDRAQTLNYRFLSDVTRAALAALIRLGEP